MYIIVPGMAYHRFGDAILPKYSELSSPFKLPISLLSWRAVRTFSCARTLDGKLSSNSPIAINYMEFTEQRISL